MTDGIGNAALIALLAIVPLVVLMLTSFVKLSVVLALLRNAIGSPDAPSGLVVLGLALVLTFFVMAPVAVEMVGAATSANSPAPAPPPSPDAPSPGSPSPGSPSPGSPSPDAAPPTGAPSPPAPAAPLDIESALRQAVPAQYKDDVAAAARAVVPLKAWLAKHVDARDKQTFVELAGRMGRASDGSELWVLAPSFLATELREAFAIAVLIFLPFLVIDLVVGLALAALGLVNTQPQTITLPLKLLLFVAVDGWRLLLDSLLRGYV